MKKLYKFNILGKDEKVLIYDIVEETESAITCITKTDLGIDKIMLYIHPDSANYATPLYIKDGYAYKVADVENPKDYIYLYNLEDRLIGMCLFLGTIEENSTTYILWNEHVKALPAYYEGCPIFIEDDYIKNPVYFKIGNLLEGSNIISATKAKIILNKYNPIIKNLIDELDMNRRIVQYVESNMEKDNKLNIAATIKELRDMTGGGLMNCKKALVACDMNMDKAVEYLKQHSTVPSFIKYDPLPDGPDIHMDDRS